MNPIKLTRRSLFSGGAALVAGAALPAGRASAAAKPLPLKIGLASYSLHKRSFDEMLQVCQQHGIRYLTLKDVHLPRTATPDELAASRAKLEAAGIQIMGGGVINMKNDEAAVRKDFEYAKAAKLPLIVAMPSVDALDLVEKMIKEFNIPVAIHNHGPEDKNFPSPSDILKAINKRDKRLGVCMDVGHTVRANGDPVKLVAQLGDRLMDLHIKDLRDLSNKESQTEVGHGSIDLVGVFKALVKRRFAGHVALEYEINNDDPAAKVAGIRESLAYMRGLAAALA